MKILAIYLAAINAAAFVVMAVDKYRAQHQQWRVREFTLMLLALLGGGGVFAYLKLFKNKPKTKGYDSLDDYDYGEEDSEEWETEDEESEEPDADGGSTEEDDEDSVK